MSNSENESEALREKVTELEKQVELLSNQNRGTQRTVRKRSKTMVMGIPLYDIATGPDPEKGELRGYARGMIAIGDIATGVIALGGVARGVIAIGGIALGLFGFGGVSIGILTAIGGVAIGTVAIGGVAVGVYALGGAAVGLYVIKGAEQDPAAIEFFNQWLPGFHRDLPAQN